MHNNNNNNDNNNNNNNNKRILLNFHFVELYPFEISIPGISVKVSCSYKGLC